MKNIHRPHPCLLILLLLLSICATSAALAITPPPGSTNRPPIEDDGGGSANPWDGSSSDDPQDPSPPPPGPCYEWEDGSPGDWIDQCSTERAAFIEAEKKLKEETKKIVERFDKLCGWWQDWLKKEFYSKMDAAVALSHLTCATLVGVAGNLPAGMPSAITQAIGNGSSAASLVEALMGAYNSFWAGLTAYQLEQLKQDIQKQMDDKAACLANLGVEIQNLKEDMDNLKDEYDQVKQEYEDALESFQACCPEFDPEEIDPPDFNCPQPSFDPMEPQGLRLPC